MQKKSTLRKTQRIDVIVKNEKQKHLLFPGSLCCSTLRGDRLTPDLVSWSLLERPGAIVFVVAVIKHEHNNYVLVMTPDVVGWNGEVKLNGTSRYNKIEVPE